MDRALFGNEFRAGRILAARIFCDGVNFRMSAVVQNIRIDAC